MAVAEREEQERVDSDDGMVGVVGLWGVARQKEKEGDQRGQG